MIKKCVYVGIFILVVMVIFQSWFGDTTLSSGDWGYLFPSYIKTFSWIPQAWDPHYGGGLGGNDIFLLALNSYFYATMAVFYRVFHLSWVYLERVIWFMPFLMVASVSAYALYRQVFLSFPYALLSSLIYLVNTYCLMIVGGGQVGVAMGYAFAPLILLAFVKLYQRRQMRERMRWIIAAGGIFSLQLLFDLRMAYITLIALAIFIIYFLRERKNYSVISILFSSIIPFVITILLHFYWLLPFVIQGKNPLVGLGDEFVNLGMVKFLSFSPFEHSLSLLHPNWPENVFGKILFLQSEFLLIPIIAFSALVFVSKQKLVVLLFALLGMLGAFLSKGANPPYGGVYLWLFDHVPGFIMLRDSTKFNLLTALSYSMLIPFTLSTIDERIRGWKKKKQLRTLVRVAVIVVFLAYWLVAHREAISGKLTGTFSPRDIPAEYVQLAEYLSRQNAFSRVLWVPSRQRYGYFSNDMPGLSLSSVQLASPAAFIDWTKNDNNIERLARYGVSHIIVPTDPLGELFVTDRKYDNTIRNAVVSVLRSKDTLTEIFGFGRIAVFHTKHKPYDHVFIAESPYRKLEIRRMSSTQYQVSLPSFSGSRSIIFSESYDPYWELVFDGRHVSPRKTSDGLQMYPLDSSVGGIATIQYRLQKFVLYGLIVSLGTVVILIGFFLYATISLWKRKHVSSRVQVDL